MSSSLSHVTKAEVAKEVRKEVAAEERKDIELKRNNFYTWDFKVGNGGVEMPLTTIAQSTTASSFNKRSGTEIRVKSIRFAYTICSTKPLYSPVRVTVLELSDYLGNPAVGDYIETIIAPGSAAPVATDYLLPWCSGYPREAKIFYDRTHHLQPSWGWSGGVGVSGGSSVRAVLDYDFIYKRSCMLTCNDYSFLTHVFIKTHHVHLEMDHPVNYSGDPSGTNGLGRLFLLLLSDVPQAGDCPVIRVNGFTYFTDA